MKIILSMLVIISGIIWAFPSLSKSFEKRIREKTCRNFKATRTAYFIYQISLSLLILILPVDGILKSLFFICQLLYIKRENRKVK